MASKTIVTLTDDIDGTEADETVHFTFGGTAYEIDLSEANANKFDEAMAPYVDHARRVGRVAPSGKTITPTPARRPKGNNAEIRAWAAAHGHKVGDKGRIPARVVDAYNNRSALEIAQDASAAAAPAAFSG